jgi:SpoVK/Ycf46/Vps4 family AAA+-type ATPase
MNNSLLLYGPPGCGKTTVAKYVAKKTNLPLVTVRLDGMVSSLLGSTAKNIRKIFDYASKRDCILFLDEFDVIAKLRDDKNDLGELKRVVNSLLQNIDDFSGNSVLIAATNHHQLLDPAVWRRFNTVLALDVPKSNERMLFLERLLGRFPNDISNNNSKIDTIVKALEDKSYSAIENIVNNSIKRAIIQDDKELTSYALLFDIYRHDNHEIQSEEDLIRI